MSAAFEGLVSGSPSHRKNLLEEEEPMLTKHGRCGVSNLCVLYVVALLFGGFCVAELIGALVRCNWTNPVCLMPFCIILSPVN